MSGATHADDAHHADRMERERRIHDDMAASLAADLMPPAAPGPLDQAMLSEAAIGPGSRVLDLGCGSGDLTLILLSLGAEVTALDLSPGMIEVARQRIDRFGAGRTARLVAEPVESVTLDPGSFDVIVGRFILHHLEIAQAAPQISRMLRPGGRAVFAENSARNRILMIARNHIAGRFGVPRLGTPDERPISAADIEAFRPHFASVSVTYPVFELLRIFDRQILRFRHPRASRACAAVDRLAGRLPALRPYSFRLLLTVEARQSAK